jgi:hypothetical protein
MLVAWQFDRKMVNGSIVRSAAYMHPRFLPNRRDNPISSPILQIPFIHFRRELSENRRIWHPPCRSVNRYFGPTIRDLPRSLLYTATSSPSRPMSPWGQGTLMPMRKPVTWQSFPRFPFVSSDKRTPAGNDTPRIV